MRSCKSDGKNTDGNLSLPYAETSEMSRTSQVRVLSSDFWMAVLHDLDGSLSRNSHTPPADVAQALMPAVSRFISIPFRVGDTVSERSAGMECLRRVAPEHL